MKETTPLRARVGLVAAGVFSLISSLQVIGLALFGYLGAQFFADIIIHALVGWVAIQVLDGRTQLSPKTSILVPLVVLPIYHTIAAFITYGSLVTAFAVVVSALVWIVVGSVAWAISILVFRLLVKNESRI